MIDDPLKNIRPDTYVFRYDISGLLPDALFLSNLQQITGVYRVEVESEAEELDADFKSWMPCKRTLEVYSWKPKPEDVNRIKATIDYEIGELYARQLLAPEDETL